MTIRQRLHHATKRVVMTLTGFWNRIEDTWADQFKTQRAPNKYDLVSEYRGLAHAMANINAQAVAQVPWRLMVRTRAGDEQPKCATRAVSASTRKMLRETKMVSELDDVEEVIDHPLIDLLSSPNEWMTEYELIETTDVFLEVTGTCYWYPEPGEFGEIAKIWILPTHLVTPIWGPMGILYYLFGALRIRFEPEDLVIFRFPNLKDLYGEGWSPVRAAYETINILNKDNAYVQAMSDNSQRPDVIVSPKEGLGPEESIRMDRRFRKKFAKGAAGGVLFTESGVDVKTLNYTSKEMEMLARRGVSKQDLANTFGVPLSILVTADVSRANAEAGHYQHAKLAVRPRCLRLQGVINSRLCPLFDERLFVVFDNPVPEDVELKIKERESMLSTGQRTINELRQSDGLDDVEWGEEPWLSTTTMQPSGMEHDHDDEAGTDPGAATAGAGEGVAGAGAAPPAPAGQDIQVSTETVLNGTQSATLLAILQAVSAGDIPRDAGVQAVMVSFNLPRARAEQIVGTAGTGTRVTPNENEKADQAAEDARQALQGKPPEKPAKPPKDEAAAGKVLDYLGLARLDRMDHATVTRGLESLGVGLIHAARYASYMLRPLPEREAYGQKCCTAQELELAAVKAAKGRKIPDGAKLKAWLKRTFAAQRVAVLKQVRQQFAKALSDVDVDLGDWTEDMAKQAGQFIEVTVGEGADITREALVRRGATPDKLKWNVKNSKAQEAIKRMTFDFCDETNESTTKGLRRAIKELTDVLQGALESDDGRNTAAELTRAVNEIFDDAEEWRAARIALTESSRASHLGQYLMAEDSGIVKGLKWILSDDACPLCKEIASKNPNGVALGDNFYQHDGGSDTYSDVPFPPAHPYCMCSMEEVVDEAALKDDND